MDEVIEGIEKLRRVGQATFEGNRVVIALNYSLCTNCGLCISNCPRNILVWQEKAFRESKHKIDIVGISDLSQCDGCKVCEKSCRAKAIVIK